MTLSQQLRELAGKATQGPWEISPQGATIRANRIHVDGIGHESIINTRITFGYDGSAKQRFIDYRLIVELRNNIETLLTALELQERLDKPETVEVVIANYQASMGLHQDEAWEDAKGMAPLIINALRAREASHDRR